MSGRTIGVVLGCAAAATFQGAYLLLAAQARRAAPVRRPGASSLLRLARRPWWLVAMALNGVAFALEIAALRHVSLVVVQPLLAIGLIGLVAGARVVLGERVDARRLVGVALIGFGATVVIAGAPAAGRTPGLTAGAGTVVAVGALLAALASPWFARGGSAWLLVAAAAAGDTLVALATNEVAAAWPHRLIAALAGVVAVAFCGLWAVTSESAAVQRLPASRVAPLVSGVQVTLPALLTALLAHERWSSALGGGAVLGAGVLLVGAGAVCVGAAGVAAPQSITAPASRGPR